MALPDLSALPAAQAAAAGPTRSPNYLTASRVWGEEEGG